MTKRQNVNARRTILPLECQQCAGSLCDSGCQLDLNCIISVHSARCVCAKTSISLQPEPEVPYSTIACRGTLYCPGSELPMSDPSLTLYWFPRTTKAQCSAGCCRCHDRPHQADLSEKVGAARAHTMRWHQCAIMRTAAADMADLINSKLLRDPTLKSVRLCHQVKMASKQANKEASMQPRASLGYVNKSVPQCQVLHNY